MAFYYVCDHSKALVPSQPVNERSMVHSDNAFY
jgi:xanthine dehydrogenase molybdopterin-binding subunit B